MVQPFHVCPLATRTKAMDEQLNTLIHAVEKLISRGGGKQ